MTRNTQNSLSARSADFADRDRLGDDVGAFLDFLDRDMTANPHRISPMTEAQFERIRELIKGVKVDLDETIDGDVGL